MASMVPMVPMVHGMPIFTEKDVVRVYFPGVFETEGVAMGPGFLVFCICR